MFVCRCVYSAAVWYYNHLAGMMNIVMITEDPEAIAQYSSLTSGVYVISVQVCDILLHYCLHNISLIDKQDCSLLDAALCNIFKHLDHVRFQCYKCLI